MMGSSKEKNIFRIDRNIKEEMKMKKSLRNLVVGAVMAATVITASATAFAGQYVQTNGWDLIRYNGKTGYIHGGNLGSTFVAKQQAKPAAQTQNYSSTQNYFDNNWTGTAANMNANADVSTWKTVSVASGYLALRNDATYDRSNEIGQLNNGDRVEIEGTGAAGSYVFVYSPKYDRCGWVNAGFLI